LNKALNAKRGSSPRWARSEGLAKDTGHRLPAFRNRHKVISQHEEAAMSARFAEQVALVAGRAASLAFLEEGATVVVTYPEAGRI
jgi:hypothetical protein